jgi:hypothetical protein
MTQQIVNIDKPLDPLLIKTPIGYVAVAWDKVGGECNFYVTPPRNYTLMPPRGGDATTLIISVKPLPQV